VTDISHRIKAVTDPAVPNCGAVLTVHPENGEEVTVRVDTPPGQPATAVSWDLLEQKLASLARAAFTEAEIAAIAAAARSLADGGSAVQLAAVLSPKNGAVAQEN
jgi:hypothetical protein